jgi:putative NADH-flavin reductase
MQIAVFGATGWTGTLLVRQALDRDHEVVAFVRRPDNLQLEGESLSVVQGDVYSGENVADAIAGVDAVVSVLGQTDDGPDDLLTVGGDRIMTAMAEAGVTRFVTLVGASVRTEGESVSLSGTVVGGMLKLLTREGLEDAKAHVEQVRTSDLDWTVARAPRLTDGEGTGSYRAGDIALGSDSIARADVASFILDCLENDWHVGELPKVGTE